MHEVLEPEETLPKTNIERYTGLSPKYIVIIAFMVIVSGVYLGTVLFGNNSVEAFIQLQEYEENLEEKVSLLKEENAQIQKEYFELKELTSGE